MIQEVMIDHELHHLNLQNEKYQVSVDRCQGLPIVILKAADLETNNCGDILTEDERLMKKVFGGEQVSLTPEHARQIANALLQYAAHCERYPEVPSFKKRREKREMSTEHLKG